ncbi:hypothetical protein [Micromonospora sp. NBC_00421]|uniref:hypothetical protein n=1 Tax=Micromonospora sp. NBC_00421 TaxID=2975976 RepID=UPI002E1D082B
MTELPTNILTDAGFTADEADAIVQGLVQGIDLHQDTQRTHSINIDELPPEKKEALERFNMAVAADF